jgi:predicted nucleic acid-binding protein
MFLLDTTVLSEAMRPSPDPNVLAWLDSQPALDVWICTVTVVEIRLSIALLPNWKRKDTLLDLAEHMFVNDFSGSRWG